MRGFHFALSGLIGLLLINQPFFSLFFLLLLVFIVIRTKNKRMLLILCAIIVIFGLRTFIHEQMNISNLTGNERTFSGKIIDIPHIDGNDVTFQVKLPSNEVIKTNYRLKTADEKREFEQLQVGMVCSFSGKLDTPHNQNNPGSLDYKRFLKQQGIHWILSLHTLQHCKNDSLTVIDRIKQYRQKGLERIQVRFFKSSAGIAQALLFGERSAIETEVIDAYQTLGLIHVLVVSGLHVGVILAFLYWILLRIGLVREKVNAMLLLFLPFYVLFTGAAPSVMRAAIMAAAIIVGMLFRKKLHPLESISFAFLLLTFYNPNLLYHVGFQLSFLISFGLIVSTTLITTFFNGAVSRLIAISVIAQLISIPLILFHFHHISILSVLVNILFVPLFSMIVLPLTFLSFLIELILSPLAKPLISLHEIIITFIHAILTFIENLPLASITLGQTVPLFIVFYYVAIFYLFIRLEGQETFNRSSFKYSIPFILLIVMHFSYPYVNPFGKVTMINVGQGDSILIELPFRKAVYLIDTGGTLFFGVEEEWQERRSRFDVGEDVIVPVLKAEGIRTIDKLILTHGDEDHIGGTNAILDHVKVKELVYGKSNQFEDNEKRLLTTAYEKKVKLSFVQKGMSWREGTYSFHILGPTGEEASKNDRSIIMYTQLGNTTWLFMGDAEHHSEMNLLRNYPNLQADVLKVGHHGSQTSTSEALVESVKPKVALISVGRNNSYGHPHDDVVSRLNERKISILRTDEHGAIQFQFSNQNGYFLKK